MSERHTIRTRVPAQAVMREVVRGHAELTRRSTVARLFGASPLHPESQVFYKRALAELAVGDALDRLSPEWDVLHGVQIHNGDVEIDHIAIGPTGVFAIGARNYVGDEVLIDGEKITAGGELRGYAQKARADAALAAELLSAAARRPVIVNPVIAIVTRKLTIRAQPEAVVVIAAHRLVPWLTAPDRELDGDVVADISDVADRVATWNAVPARSEDTDRLSQDFARVRHEVAVARRRRMTWAAVAFVVLCAAVWGTVALVVTKFVVPL